MIAPWIQRRPGALRQAAREQFDLLIVGGGIVGAGIARDAAMRGIKTVLAECGDFAHGTSSRSSRLLHGGIRYLAQGRIRLVREASVEKTILHRIAPHLAKPLPFVFPAYRASSEWPFWQLRIGVRIYDLLCSGRNLGRSSSLNAAETLRKVPALNSEDLSGAVRYFDGLTQDARLVLDTLRSAEQNGALLLNEVRFTGSKPGTEGFICETNDGVSGESFEIRARTVVNATGPWSHALPGSAVQLRLTKGIHVVFPREKLPVNEAVVLTEGNRVLFVIPWGERLIIGTTDTDFSGPPESARTEPADIEYLLGNLRRFFPGVSWDENEIISSWSGLRPLIADSRRGPSDISRSHQIRRPRPGWWDVAGGKLTTYRLIAEQTVNQIASALDGTFRPCSTATRPLLADTAGDSRSGVLPPAFSRETIEYFCAREWALHLDDVLLRRSSWHFYDGPRTDRAELCAKWMGELLGWSEAQREQELERYRDACDFPRVPEFELQTRTVTL